MWNNALANAVKSGNSHSLVILGVTVNFPSNRFCGDYVDDNFLDHVLEVVNRGTGDYGNGAVTVDRTTNCGHRKLTGGEAIGYKWNGPNILDVTGYGTKGGKGAARKGSGGYTWQS